MGLIFGAAKLIGKIAGKAVGGVTKYTAKKAANQVAEVTVLATAATVVGAVEKHQEKDLKKYENNQNKIIYKNQNNRHILLKFSDIESQNILFYDAKEKKKYYFEKELENEKENFILYTTCWTKGRIKEKTP